MGENLTPASRLEKKNYMGLLLSVWVTRFISYSLIKWMPWDLPLLRPCQHVQTTYISKRAQITKTTRVQHIHSKLQPPETFLTKAEPSWRENLLHLSPSVSFPTASFAALFVCFGLGVASLHAPLTCSPAFNHLINLQCINLYSTSILWATADHFIPPITQTLQPINKTLFQHAHFFHVSHV